MPFLVYEEVNDVNLATIMKAFTNETRLRILILLYHQTLCVCELQGILDQSQPLISKQLKILKELDLIDDIRKDKYVYYSLKNHPIIMDTIQSNMLCHETQSLFKQDLDKLTDTSMYRNGKC